MSDDPPKNGTAPPAAAAVASGHVLVGLEEEDEDHRKNKNFKSRRWEHVPKAEGDQKITKSTFNEDWRSKWYWPIYWYLEWALPGFGMFSEAYIIFSAGQIGGFQAMMWPTCYKSYTVCDVEMVQHLAGYIQICGIMAGMLFWGFIGDYTGRKWGSRCVAAIMLSGCILLTFTPQATTAYGYFCYFMVAQTWYGFGVGGEYPMAASSAAERSATTPELRHLRAQQVILVFSGQGMGNLVNCCVILVSMAIFKQTGTSLTPWGSSQVLSLTYGIGALCCLALVAYRFMYLGESALFLEETEIEKVSAAAEAKAEGGGAGVWNSAGWKKHLVALKYFSIRQFIASAAWIANDFAFYGNKLQQNLFISLLYPTASPYVKQQWTVLNSFIALLGYWLAAALCDKPWYGRVRCQYIGFTAMFVFYIIIYAQWNNMGGQPVNKDKSATNMPGMYAFQALYYLSSFFNQFGPNATTWLVAGEIFPTNIRAAYHGFAATMGKLGAIIATLWISYIPQPSQTYNIFLVSAIWGIAGAFVTWLFLPDTTGLDLEEYDRMMRYMMEGRFKDYHGEAVNPKHLSVFEIYVQRWGKQYDPVLDKEEFEAEIKQFAMTNMHGTAQALRMQHLVEELDPNVRANVQHAKEELYH